MSNLNKNSPYRTANTLAPQKEPKGLFEPIPFTGSAISFNLDLTLEAETNKSLVPIQSIFIDNSTNGEAFSITSVSSQQTIVAPPYSQSYHPFLITDPPKFICASTGGVTVNLQFLNFFVEPQVWIVQASDLTVISVPSDTGGITASYSAAGGSVGNAGITGKTLIKAGSASLYGLALWNNGAAITYLQVFDAASTAAVTLGTTIPKFVFQVGGNNSWEEKFAGEGRLAFLNGIVVAATTTPTGATTTSTPLTGNFYVE